MQKIAPCLWFDGQAEEAMMFYVSVFKDSKVGTTTYYGDYDTPAPGKPGEVLTCTFEILGQTVMALNGGPQFKFSEAVSLIVECEDQQEIDDYTEKLSAVPEAEICGWVKDKFGMSWQIVPKSMYEILATGDQAKIDRVMKEVMNMKKLDIATLEKAAAG